MEAGRERDVDMFKGLRFQACMRCLEMCPIGGWVDGYVYYGKLMDRWRNGFWTG